MELYYFLRRTIGHYKETDIYIGYCYERIDPDEGDRENNTPYRHKNKKKKNPYKYDYFDVTNGFDTYESAEDRLPRNRKGWVIEVFGSIKQDRKSWIHIGKAEKCPLTEKVIIIPKFLKKYENDTVFCNYVGNKNMNKENL